MRTFVWSHYEDVPTTRVVPSSLWPQILQSSNTNRTVKLHFMTLINNDIQRLQTLTSRCKKNSGRHSYGLTCQIVNRSTHFISSELSKHDSTNPHCPRLGIDERLPSSRDVYPLLLEVEAVI